MGFQGKVIGRRKAPYPNSILDRKALTEALEADGISVKRLHIDAFYKAFDIKEGDKMYIAPEDRVRIW